MFVEPSVSLSSLLDGQRSDISGRTEARLADYAAEIVASGFPELRSMPPVARRAAISGYIDRIVERDLEVSGYKTRSPAALRRWMAAYAAATSTATSYEKIRDAATGGYADKPSRKATKPYIDTLERLYIIDPVPGWHPMGSPLSRLSDAPKHHLADPALAAALLQADAQSLLAGSADVPIGPSKGNLLGALFESLLALNLRVYSQACEAAVGHLRKWGGEREVDFIVTSRTGQVVAIEVKLARSINDNDVRHLHWLQQELGDALADAAIITTGPSAYRRSDGIAVVPAALLGP